MYSYAAMFVLSLCQVGSFGGVRLYAQPAEAGTNPPYYGRTDYRLIPDGDRVLLVGGGSFDAAGNGTFYNDLWETKDFVKWEKLAGAVFEKAPPFVSFFRKEGHLVLFNTAATNKNVRLQFVEVDGGQVKKASYDAIPRECLESTDETLLEVSLSGVFDYSNTRVFDFQSSRVLIDSSKGVWKEESGKWKNVRKAIKAFAAIRSSSALAMHEDEAYLLGGNVREWEDYDGYCNDVWKSRDGVSWQLISKKSGAHDVIRDDFQSFPARAGAVGVSFKGKLYVVGGYRRQKYFYDDVWASTDGVKWEQIAGKVYSFGFSEKDFRK